MHSDSSRSLGCKGAAEVKGGNGFANSVGDPVSKRESASGHGYATKEGQPGAMRGVFVKKRADGIAYIVCTERK